MGNFFWCRAITRAHKETCHFLGIGNLKRLTISGILATIAVIVIKFIGVTGQMNEEWRWILAVIVAAIIFYVPMFFWNLIKAPGRMEVDVQTQNKRYNAEINAKLNDVQQRNQILEEERIPRFSVVPITGVRGLYERTVYTAWAKLEIKNTSPAIPLEDVSVQIVELTEVYENEDVKGVRLGVYHFYEPYPSWNPSLVYWSEGNALANQLSISIPPGATRYWLIAFHRENDGGLGTFKTPNYQYTPQSKIVIEVSSPNSPTWRGIAYPGEIGRLFGVKPAGCSEQIGHPLGNEWRRTKIPV